MNINISIMPSTISPMLVSHEVNAADQEEQAKKTLTPEQMKKAAEREKKAAEKKEKREKKTAEKDRRADEKDRTAAEKAKTAEDRRIEKELLKTQPKPEEAKRLEEEMALIANEIEENAEFAKQEPHTKKSLIESNRLGDVLHMA
jgi:hypothetical protein